MKAVIDYEINEDSTYPDGSPGLLDGINRFRDAGDDRAAELAVWEAAGAGRLKAVGVTLENDGE